MFGSISNWINTNMPQVPPVSMPSMPNMPSIPKPNMPAMPDIFGKNKSAAPAEEQPNTESPVQNLETNSAVEESKLEQDAGEIETVSNGDAAQAAEGEQANSKAGLMNPLDIDAQKALGTAKEIGSNIGSMLFSFGKNASSNVMKTAGHLKGVIEKTTIIGDFSKENEKFVNEKKNQQRKEEAAVPPWVGLNEEDRIKEEIMALSSDSRNFLRNPPVDFEFDFNVAYPVALATLEEDANLKEMRFKLVPVKINEETFWRNYFYRVQLIKQSAQNSDVNDHSAPNSEDESPMKRETESAVANASISETHNEFVSDSYEHGAINVEDIKSDLKQLNLDNKKLDADIEDPEWDKELPEDLDSISAEELEKEINQMIGK